MNERFILGASLALTGPEAPYARQLNQAIELALEDEGLASVSVEVIDDEAETATARAGAERLVADPRVLAVVGPMNSWTCEVQGPIYAAHGLAQITPSASNPDLCRRGWNNFFRMCANDLAQGEALARVAAQLVNAKTVAAVHDGTSFGAPLAKVF